MPQRAVWKGAISFGMVVIPVKLYPATEHRDIRFVNLHKDTHTRIRMKRWSPHHDAEVTLDDLVHDLVERPLGALVEGVGRVAVDAAQVARGRAHEGARQAAAHGLAGRLPVHLVHPEPGRIDRCPDRMRHPFRGVHDRAEGRGRRLEHVLPVGLRDDEDVPGRKRREVQERERVRIVPDWMRARGAGDDAAEDAVLPGRRDGHGSARGGSAPAPASPRRGGHPRHVRNRLARETAAARGRHPSSGGKRR